MLIKVNQKYTRQTPRKVRLVANAVKGLSIAKAVEQLGLIERKSSIVVLKVLRQALAAAEHNFNLSVDQLKIHSILVGTGPTYKRFRAVSRGRAHTILKRTSHITVILEAKDQKTQAPAKSASKALPQTSKKITSEIKTTKESIKQAKTVRSTVKEIKEGKGVTKPQTAQAQPAPIKVRRTTHK